MAGPRNLPDPETPGGPDVIVATAADLITEWRLSRPVMQRMIRALHWLLPVTVLIGVALIAVAVAAFTLIGRNTATVAELHASNVDACQTGNTRLAEQRQALDSVLAIGSRRHLTPAQRAQEQRFKARAEAFIAAGWAPRDCGRLYALKGK